MSINSQGKSHMRRASARKPGNNRHARRGALLVLAAAMVVVIVGMIAFAVDVGYITLVRTQLQVAADAGALAGASLADKSISEIEEEVFSFASLNVRAARTINRDDVEIQLGDWDSDTRRFTPGTDEVSAIKVTVQSKQQPLFFGRVLGHDKFNAQAEAVATFCPREIMLVLDFSASMCYDSQVRSIDALGRDLVEASLLQIYRQLGAPTFGRMQWDPRYIGANDTRTIKRKLGLQNVPYPYPPDKWENYINYVRNDSTIARAGFRKKYGYLTWVNYLQDERCRYSQTPNLWMTSEQPVTAVKDAVDLMTAYLEKHCLNDRVGLSIYTASDGTAVLESSLTHNFEGIADTTRNRQAG
ncbi:MAG: hypothetical protein JSW71_06875, partial [Gemmatimonadota bacterium]